MHADRKITPSAQTWRTTPGTEGTEQRAKVPCWVYRYPGSPADTGEVKYQYETPREDVRRATIGPDGNQCRVLLRFIIATVVR